MDIIQMGKNAKTAASELAQLSKEAKREALFAVADAIEELCD